MLNIQQFLQSGKTYEDLEKDLAIKPTFHPTLPLVIFNYSQIDSPKTNPLVREARGCVYNTETKTLVSNCMRRFFNWGEVQDEMDLFDWSTVTAQAKEDGSLITFYHFDGEWHVNTRGSFANAPMLDEYSAKYFGLPVTFTWKDGILRALGINSLKELNGVLDSALTYVGEFCSLYNKVVREYREPKVFLITRFDGEQEIGPAHVDIFHDLKVFTLNTAEAVLDYVNSQPEATFEGVVVKDANNSRWKLKNARYVALHHIKGNNGEGLYKPANLMPYILKGEGAELLTYYPEVTDCFNEYKEKVEKAYADLEVLWKSNWQIENQKDFALSIFGKTKFTGVLFNLRKELGKNQSVEALKKAWRNNTDGILKQLF